MNKIMIIGNLGRDPELNYTPDGAAVAKFSVAENYRKGTTQLTEWHNIVVWRQTAEFIGTYGKKGAKVFVEGTLRTRKYTDKQGTERVAIEITASNIELLDKKDTSAKDGSGDPLGELEDHPF